VSGPARAIEAVLEESGPDFEEFSFERPTAGHQGEVFLVSLTYRGEEYEVVVKFQPDDEGFALEPFLHDYVADRTGVPVPRILVSNEEPKSGVPPYFVTERVEGENLAESLGSLDSAVRERVVGQAGRILGDLHANVGFEGFGRLALDGDDDRLVVTDLTWDWQEFFRNLAEGYIARLAGGPFEDVQRAARDHLDDAIGVVGSGHVPRLVHDDFRPANTLFDPGRAAPITAVLDWQFALAADPEYHVARTDFLFVDPAYEDPETRARLRERLYAGYREFCEFDPDEGYEYRRTVYQFATLLWRMAGFEAAFEESSELALARAEAQFRQQFERLAGRLPEA
jgi:Ser/Thr protein kinase RdoA (MazF antagonist)